MTGPSADCPLDPSPLLLNAHGRVSEPYRPFLKRWSEEWITAHDPERDAPLDEDVVRDAWLGFAPASADEVAAAEARLGCSLPPSLREFLLVTNGWRHAG